MEEEEEGEVGSGSRCVFVCGWWGVEYCLTPSWRGLGLPFVPPFALRGLREWMWVGQTVMHGARAELWGVSPPPTANSLFFHFSFFVLLWLG